MKFQLTYKPFGARAILIEWEAKIATEILRDIIRFRKAILANKVPQIEEGIIGYNSLTLLYADTISDFEIEKNSLQRLYKEASGAIETTTTLWKIPVCYDEVFGIDLDEMSKVLQLSKKEIVAIHSQTIYTVYFIGFLPGFLYLGGLDDRLVMPRKATPRLSVTKGSVAIGGAQTGIYPMDSAGGWNIIGKTPISFFDVESDAPCFATSGDRLQFVPIALADYKRLEVELRIGLFDHLNTLLDD